MIWVVAQSAAVALLRGGAWAVPSSRYADIFAFGVLVNFCALLRLMETWPPRQATRGLIYALATAWTLFVLVGLAQQTRANLAEQLPMVGGMLATQESNVRKFVMTGDPATVAGKTYPEIPYPTPSRITELVGDPEFRKILPAALRFEPDRSPEELRMNSGSLSVPSNFLLRHAWLVVGAGFILLLIDLLVPRFSQSRIANQLKPR